MKAFYYELGGFFDHVHSPKAPNPDGIYTVDRDNKNITYRFDRLGVRVPVAIVSPWVPKGKVVHEPNGLQPDSQFSHASIPATLCSIFKLTPRPLTDREAWAGNFESILLNTPRDDCPLVMPAENRAFDTIFGYLTHTTDIDNLVGKEPFCNYVNVNDPNSLKVCTAPNQVDTSIYGPDHGYFETTNELYGTNDPSVPLPEVAPMNGFAQQAYNSAFKGADAAHLQQVMAGFDPKNIPVHATLASEFTIFDRWFAAIPGPTQPNRVSSHCATSKGWYNNDGTKLAEGNDCRSIFQDLSDAGLTWKNYFQEVPSFFFLRNTRLQMAANSKVWSSFVSDAQSGNLPNYSFLEPNFGELKQNQATYNGNLQLIVDGHAGEPGFFHNAEYFLKELYETLRNSPQWESTLLLITYDEHGGFFDHVPPPKAPNPDGITTPDPDHAGVVYSFDRLGVRVPVIAVSPWVAKGKVEHEPKGPHPDSQYSHASIPATIRSIFKLSSPPLTAREAWSGDFESILMDTPRDDCPYVMPAVNMNGF